MIVLQVCYSKNYLWFHQTLRDLIGDEDFDVVSTSTTSNQAAEEKKRKLEEDMRKELEERKKKKLELMKREEEVEMVNLMSYLTIATIIVMKTSGNQGETLS